MKRIGKVLIVLSLLIASAGYVLADELVIFPAKGQNSEQMEQDKFACYQWAKGQTGFDPMAPPTATSPPPEESKGGVVSGAAKGAVLGLAVGAIAGNAGKGAAIGAGSGGLIGGIRKSEKKSEQEDWENQQVQQYEARRGQYNRAYTACLEGKGYTVK